MIDGGSIGGCEENAKRRVSAFGGCIFHGFRLPLLRSCAGMTDGEWSACGEDYSNGSPHPPGARMTDGVGSG